MMREPFRPSRRASKPFWPLTRDLASLCWARLQFPFPVNVANADQFAARRRQQARPALVMGVVAFVFPLQLFHTLFLRMRSREENPGFPSKPLIEIQGNPCHGAGLVKQGGRPKPQGRPRPLPAGIPVPDLTDRAGSSRALPLELKAPNTVPAVNRPQVSRDGWQAAFQDSRCLVRNRPERWKSKLVAT